MAINKPVKEKSSRIPGFYNLRLEERQAQLAQAGGLTPDDLAALTSGGLTADLADPMIENVVGVHALPLGIALNFVVNRREVLVPMAIEEPSVVAGASFMARLARAGGGFIAETTPPEMIGQMQILDVPDLPAARQALQEAKTRLLEEAAEIDPVIKRLGGGPRDLEVRTIANSPIGPFLVLHLIYDVRDAMGANAVNTAVEHLTPLVNPFLAGGCTCVSCPTLRTGAWRSRAAPSPLLSWPSTITLPKKCVMASSRPGLLQKPILTGRLPTIKAS